MILHRMSVLEMAVGWLAPPTCVGCEAEGAALCIACFSSEILPFGERCFSCNKLSPRSKTCTACRARGAPNRAWVSTDHEGLAKDLVQKFKFGHQRAAAAAIAKIMADNFLSQNNDSHIKSKNYVVVPVPTASSRMRQRSFDHTYLLSEKLSQQLGLEMKIGLGRLGQTKQMGASRHKRADQAKNTYYAKRSGLFKSRNILLVDDVVTTGATLSEAAKILRKAGARSVDALVFAKHL